MFPINRFGDAGGLIIARKKRSTHSFILTERASGKTAADARIPMAEKRLRTEMRKVALEPDG